MLSVVHVAFFAFSKGCYGRHKSPHKKVDQGLFCAMFGWSLCCFLPPSVFHSVCRPPLLLPALSTFLPFTGFVYSYAILTIHLFHSFNISFDWYEKYNFFLAALTERKKNVLRTRKSDNFCWRKNKHVPFSLSNVIQSQPLLVVINERKTTTFAKILFGNHVNCFRLPSCIYAG